MTDRPPPPTVIDEAIAALRGVKGVSMVGWDAGRSLLCWSAPGHYHQEVSVEVAWGKIRIYPDGWYDMGWARHSHHAGTSWRAARAAINVRPR